MAPAFADEVKVVTFHDHFVFIAFDRIGADDPAEFNAGDRRCLAIARGKEQIIDPAARVTAHDADIVNRAHVGIAVGGKLVLDIFGTEVPLPVRVRRQRAKRARYAESGGRFSPQMFLAFSV